MVGVDLNVIGFPILNLSHKSYCKYFVGYLNVGFDTFKIYKHHLPMIMVTEQKHIYPLAFNAPAQIKKILVIAVICN